MSKKLLVLLFLFFYFPSVHAHVQQTYVDDYWIRFSHIPMEPQSKEPTTLLIYVEKAGVPLRGLDISVELSHKGSYLTTVTAEPGDLYRAVYSFPEDGTYQALVSFSDEGNDVEVPFMVPVSSIGMRLLLGGVSLAFAITFLFLFFIGELVKTAPVREYKFDMLRFSPLDRALKSRRLPIILQTPVLAIYLVLIIAGLFGAQVGGANIATVAIWTIWWTGIIILILFFGKAWCFICPWHTVTTWIKRRDLSLNLRWPGRLNNIYPAIGLFIGVTWLELGFSITYLPRYTAYFLIFLMGLAILTAMLFKRRAFCMHLCFIGAIQGIYSSVSPLELRSRDKDVCRSCSTKDCIKGNEKGDPCPVLIYAGGMKRNNSCILCMECVKTCPHDNLGLNIRPPGSELAGIKLFKAQEAFLAVSLLGLTFFHGFTMFPSWMGFGMETSWGMYYIVFTALLIGSMVFPAAVTYAFSWASGALSGIDRYTPRGVFKGFAYALIPLALAYHLAHNVMHLLMEAPILIPVLSDPLGFGWDLFGTRDYSAMPILSMRTHKYIQVALVLFGLVISNVAALRISQRLYGEESKAIKGFLPISLLVLLVAVISIVFLMQPMTRRVM
ncbi:MAG: 4Fe-4S binding protein [Candidatus Hydrothermarchaeales archaeon]